MERMEKAARRVQRDPTEITLVAVSKTVGLDKICQAIDAGASTLGENYVQEAQRKIEGLHRQGVRWHFIGHLQTNKAKYAARLFDCIQSVDSVKLARELNRRASAYGSVLDCLLEVHLSPERSKFGADPAETLTLAQEISALECLRLRGLMTMPPYFDNAQKSRPYFVALRRLKEELERRGIPVTELSMGMTADFEVAIEEGATIIRVGRAIFGERSYHAR
jgi:hypothetical protein